MFFRRLLASAGLRPTARMSGYNFTEGVRHALAAAREQATTLRHGYVGTEHVLLGVLLSDDSASRALFERLQIDRAEVARATLAAARSGQQLTSAPDLPYTSRAKRVLELAMSEARENLQTYVGTEHLVAGLLREENGLAAQVLRGFGITIEAIRAQATVIAAQALSPERPGHAMGSVIVLIEKEGGRLETQRFDGPRAAAIYLNALPPVLGDGPPS